MPIERRTLLSVVLAGAARVAFAAPSNSPEGERAIGNASARHTVTEFFSLTCPHCADFALNSLPAIKARWIAPGRLHWIFSDFPTDGTALQAAMVARYFSPDQYAPFITRLFASQAVWAYQATSPTDGLWHQASDAGMDRPTFDRANADTHLRDWIVSRVTDAQTQWNVDATPGFLIDGKLYEGAISADTFSQILGS